MIIALLLLVMILLLTIAGLATTLATARRIHRMDREEMKRLYTAEIERLSAAIVQLSQEKAELLRQQMQNAIPGNEWHKYRRSQSLGGDQPWSHLQQH